MALIGGCYCGAVRYEADGPPMFKALCYCRECQINSGGGPNTFMIVAPAGFRYTKGEPRGFKRPDLENAVTREFCATCGTQLITRAQGGAMVVLKAGTLDDPSQYGAPQSAIYVCDKQNYHVLPEGLPAFDKLPG